MCVRSSVRACIRVYYNVQLTRFVDAFDVVATYRARRAVTCMHRDGARVTQTRVSTRDEHTVGCPVHAHGAHVNRVGDGRRRSTDSRLSIDSRWSTTSSAMG